MEHYCSHTYQGRGASFALGAIALCLGVVAHAPAIAAEGAPTGRLDFEAANLPEANVEVDLSQEMFHDLFGIGDAAIAGIAETLMKSANGEEGTKGTKLAAEQLEAARQIVQLAGNVIREVRVRVYEDLPEEAGDPQKLLKPFDEQLSGGKWETLARVRDNDDTVRVAAIRGGGSIQGIFVVVTDGDSVVLANIVCDISPDNVKKLTTAATKVGLENGLAAAIESKMKHMSGGGKPGPTIVIKKGMVDGVIGVEVKPAKPIKAGKPPVPPAPPAPPKAPAVPAPEKTPES
jgi:Domain of unknown function (DUF4252)